MENLDTIDFAILDILQGDGRISNTDLAQRVGLAPPTVMRRVKLLEERGFIKGYVAQLDPLLLGLPVTAFILVETQPGCDLDEAAAVFMRLAGVQEIHRLLGEWCFLLKVRTQTPQTLENLIHRDLRLHSQVRRTQTTLATSSLCNPTPIALPTGAADLQEHEQ